MLAAANLARVARSRAAAPSRTRSRRAARSSRTASGGCRSAPRSAGSRRTCAAACRRRSPGGCRSAVRSCTSRATSRSARCGRSCARAANDEPRATLEQLARWARRGELTSPRLRHDIAAAFPRIRIPLAIFFGDEDPLASVKTTRNVYRAVSSEYLLWRPVRGNSHLELTMGYDIRQICYDVKNLMSYALDHESGGNSLPRKRRARAADTVRWRSISSDTERWRWTRRGCAAIRRSPKPDATQARALALATARHALRRAAWSRRSSRAQETARLLVEGRDIPIETHACLAEGAYGALDGLQRGTELERHPEFFRLGRTVIPRLARDGLHRAGWRDARRLPGAREGGAGARHASALRSEHACARGLARRTARLSDPAAAGA